MDMEGLHPLPLSVTNRRKDFSLWRFSCCWGDGGGEPRTAHRGRMPAPVGARAVVRGFPLCCKKASPVL